MARPSEEISKYNAHSDGKPDANLANDANNLGGVPADEFATKQYVKDYHNTKEEEMEEDMENKDRNVLQQAKKYTDTVVGNQDFSNFAKIPDLEALDTKLTNQILQCGTNCETKMNTKIANVVNDVNSNFNDVNNSITNLNQNQQQLFTSVSSGKAKVAAAITDKGINTASDASFDVMATNIRDIETSGGGQEYDENFVNTADATANAADIMLGKTSYSKGKKLYGTHTDLDTSDATATASDILSGATAYVNGQKITGTYEPEEPIDTSDATATANDILSGKTAYVDGEKLTGNYTPLDTSDATANSSDILSGETAYVDGQKITGTYVPLDTSDATATASDILRGKTAYSNGEKLTGTCNPIPDYPTYGTDTTNATVTASDISAGKTAYAGGQLIVGTFAGNSNVEEVYGVNVGGYDIQEGSFRYIQEEDSEKTVTARPFVAFSKDNKYCVSVATLDSGEQVIDSFLVTEHGLTIQSSTGTNSDRVIKKYRYTKAELGLGNETIQNIALGSPGLGGSNSLCLLIIQTSTKLHLYTYHLYDNGVIGRESNNDSYYLDNFEIEKSNFSATLYAANTDPTIFFSVSTGYGIYLARHYFSIRVKAGGECEAVLTSNSTRIGSSGDWQTTVSNTLYVAPDDSYIWLSRRGGEYEGIVLLDEHLYVKNGEIISRTGMSYYETGLIEPTTKKVIRCRAGNTRPFYTSGYGIIFDVYSISTDNNTITFTLEKTINSIFDTDNNKIAIGHMVFSADYSKLIVLAATRTDYHWGSSSSDFYAKQLGIAIYNVSDILDVNATDGAEISPVQIDEYGNLPPSSVSNKTTYDWHIFGTSIGDQVLITTPGSSSNPGLVVMKAQNNTSDVIGVRYKGVFYRKE